ncbi:MAG: LamG domain-containing protein, partial [Candidatus Odinarchaeota archaeon]
MNLVILGIVLSILISSIVIFTFIFFRNTGKVPRNKAISLKAEPEVKKILIDKKKDYLWKSKSITLSKISKKKEIINKKGIDTEDYKQWIKENNLDKVLDIRIIRKIIPIYEKYKISHKYSPEDFLLLKILSTYRPNLINAPNILNEEIKGIKKWVKAHKLFFQIEPSIILHNISRIYKYFTKTANYRPQEFLWLKKVSAQFSEDFKSNITPKYKKKLESEQKRFLKFLKHILGVSKSVVNLNSNVLEESLNSEGEESRNVENLIDSQYANKCTKFEFFNSPESRSLFDNRKIINYEINQIDQFPNKKGNILIHKSLIDEIQTQLYQFFVKDSEGGKLLQILYDLEDKNDVITILWNNRDLFKKYPLIRRQILLTTILLPVLEKEKKMLLITQNRNYFISNLKKKGITFEILHTLSTFLKEIELSYIFYKNRFYSEELVSNKLEKSKRQIISSLKKEWEDYKKGVIREGNSIRVLSSLERKARNFILSIVFNNILIKSDHHHLTLFYVNQDRTKIIRKSCKSNINSEIIILAQNIKIIKKIISRDRPNVVMPDKEEVIKTCSKLSKVQKTTSSEPITPLNAIKFVLRFIPILTIILSPIISFLLGGNDGYLYKDFMNLVIILQILIYSVSLIVYTWNLILSKFHTIFVLCSPFALIILQLLINIAGGGFVSLLFTPLLLLVSLLIFRRVPKDTLNEPKKQSKTDISLNLNLKYHKNKFKHMWYSLFLLTIMFCIFFIYLPQFLYIPAFLMIVGVVVFTKKYRGDLKQFIDRVNPKLYRNAVFIIIFLNLMTLLFLTNSMITLGAPNLEFARIPQESRITGKSLDYNSLQYYSSMDTLEDLSINDAFLAKCKVSAPFGQFAVMGVQLIPKDVQEIEGYILKNNYRVHSRYLTGPLVNHELFTVVALDKLELLPGTYEVKFTYSTLTGFAYKFAEPEINEIEIGKDSLKAIPYEHFVSELDEYGIEYGACYSIKQDRSVDVIFDGRIVNSLNEPVPIDNLDLFIEDNDRWEKIATVNTDRKGRFYLKHTIYGSFEKNMLIKIQAEESSRYKELSFVEYAGIESNTDNYWFFTDNNYDNYPEWPFNLQDLLRFRASYAESPPPSSLDFMAEFDENSGTTTTERVHEYEGLLQGDTSWATGKRDYGLMFDGNSDIVNFTDILDDSFDSLAWTISTWIYPIAYTSNQSNNGIQNCFVSKDGILEIGVNESGILVYLNTYNVETTAIYGYPYSIPLNEWIFVAVRFNNSGNDVDVLIQDTWCRSAFGGANEPWSGGGVLKSGGNLVIGAESTLNSCFTGKLDDISVFNSSITDAEVESHSGGPVLELDVKVYKEDSQDVWTPITTPGDIIDGYLLFEVNSTGKPINTLEFYLSDVEPNLQNPNPDDWNLIAYFNYDHYDYRYQEQSYHFPDDSSWYFVVKATDDLNNAVYDSYDTYFGINHFDKLLNFTYLGKEGRINHNSEIGVIPKEECDWHISSLNIYINYSGGIDYLTTVDYTNLCSNYWLIYLDSLSNWVLNKSLGPDNYNLNFIIEANLTYGSAFPAFYHNFTLPSTTLDIKPPTMELLSGGSYSLILESTYDTVDNNIITMAIDSIDTDFSYIELEYSYNTPTSAEWLYYDKYYADNDSLAEIIFDIINLRDDNISIRFIGYDNLLNSEVLFESEYWFIKDLNNHPNFVVEGLSSNTLYGLDQNKMIDLDLKILPVDNDITKVEIIAGNGLEIFILENMTYEENHIYFSDSNIQFNSSFYNIFGSEFSFIPIDVKLYQGNTFITSKQVVISVIYKQFTDIITISDLQINISSTQDNVLMSFVNDLDAYNSTHGIPFVVGGLYPVVKAYDSYNDLIAIIPLYPYMDGNATKIYNETTVTITNNRFIVPVPVPQSGKICSIEEVYINGNLQQFTYFINQETNELLVTLLTTQNMDGEYNLTAPISIVYGVTTSPCLIGQFRTSYDFSLLPQNSYKFVGEFYELSGEVSTFTTVNRTLVDFHGPEIYSLFVSGTSIDPDGPQLDSISFIFDDFSGVDNYWFNTSFAGFWSISGSVYSFYFNDTNIQEGIHYITLFANDTFGHQNQVIFTLNFDKSNPQISNVQNSNIITNGLFEINATVTDNSDYSITVNCLHVSSNSVHLCDYTLIETNENVWRIVMDSTDLQNGLYNITIYATDLVGNTGTYMIGDIYFDNLYPHFNSLEDHIYVNGEIIYNTSISDEIYFNDEKYIDFQSFDTLFDNFNWSGIDETLDNQLGIKNITMFYTHPLTWYNISVSTPLNYEQFIYEITGYGCPISTILNKIKSVQSLKIGNYIIDKFSILFDGGKLLLSIDPQYRYLLSPSYNTQIFLQFYEAISEGIPLEFNETEEKWELLSSGRNYFNISDYLTLTEGQQILLWLNVEDGVGNQLISHKFRGWYDNLINLTDNSNLFNWYLGTNSTGAGILIFGSDNLLDSTIQVNTTSIAHTFNDEEDVNRIYIYGSENESTWDFVGRAYFSGEEDLWNYYWDFNLLSELPPENYFLKYLIFDKAGNYLINSSTIKVYDYIQIELLTDLVFGHIFEFNMSLNSNEQTIKGVIEEYLDGSTATLWDVIIEYYSSEYREWIKLATDPATIVAQGNSANYSITWDINEDLGFLEGMYDLEYGYLPLQIAPKTQADLWGSWIFDSNEWKPIIISKSGLNLDITVYKFNGTGGWIIDSSFSDENIIQSIDNQIFKVFDINNDNSYEVIRVSQYEVDVIYLDQTNKWTVKENITALSGYQYLSLDIAYDGSSSDTLLIINQKDNNGVYSLWLYSFDQGFDLTHVRDCETPLNFIPTTVNFVNYFSANDRKAILLAGLIEDTYYSQLIEYDIYLSIRNVIIDAILGKILIIEYDQLDGVDSIILGIERLSIGKMDAVVTFRRKSGTEEWVEFELSGFDDIRFQIIDLLAIQENNFKKLIIASKTGLFESILKSKKDINSIISPICYVTDVFSKEDLSPSYYPILFILVIMGIFAGAYHPSSN